MYYGEFLCGSDYWSGQNQHLVRIHRGVTKIGTIVRTEGTAQPEGNITDTERLVKKSLGKL